MNFTIINTNTSWACDALNTIFPKVTSKSYDDIHLQKYIIMEDIHVYH